MICLALGLGVLGFVAARKARRCSRGYYGHGWHHHHHHGWGGGGWGGRGRRGLYMALSHLDASPAQERAIIGEIDKLHERLHGAKRNLKDSRGDLAAAVRGPVLDDAALGAVLGRVDAATGEARTAALEALRNIHAVLDDKQREQLADILDRGWWRGRSHGGNGGGPYRV
ncbi:MAG TPA: Spy/CpxP family protein refolding chaperone [Kofleriaceae bacterium]